MLPKFKNLLNGILTFSLCVFYSSWIGLGILISYIFMRNTKMYTVKKRPNPPKVLESEEYGKHKFAHVNGIKLHYVEKGDPKNPLIIFVHGFPEFWYSWRHQIKEFSNEYWTIAIDQRGYSLSDKPDNLNEYHTNKMADDIRELVKSLGREKFILIAHDWGAVVGFNYVYRYMDTVEKYIMIGGPDPHAWRKLISTSLKQFMMSWYIFFFQMPYLPEITMSFYDFQLFEKLKLGTKEDVECFKYTFSQPNACTPPINYYRALRVLYPDQRLRKPQNCAPGLFMLGEFDKYISKDVGPLTLKNLDNIDYKIIKGANHFAQQHKPEETNRMIREFLEKK